MRTNGYAYKWIYVQKQGRISTINIEDVFQSVVPRSSNSIVVEKIETIFRTRMLFLRIVLLEIRQTVKRQTSILFCTAVLEGSSGDSSCYVEKLWLALSGYTER